MVLFGLLRKDASLIRKCLQVYINIQTKPVVSLSFSRRPYDPPLLHPRLLPQHAQRSAGRYFKARSVLQHFDLTAIKKTWIDAVHGRSDSDRCLDEFQKRAGTLPSNDYGEVKRQKTDCTGPCKFARHRSGIRLLPPWPFKF